MDKNKKKLISEFANVISDFSNNDILKFFSEKKYTDLKSFSEPKDLDLLKLYLKDILNVDVERSFLESSDICPLVFITVVEVDESLSKIGKIIRKKYLQNTSKDDIINKIIFEDLESKEFITQLSSVVDNYNKSNHQIDFLYFAYTSDHSNLNSIFEIKLSEISNFNIEIYKSILKTFKNNSFDKNVDKKLNNILEVLNDLKI